MFEDATFHSSGVLRSHTPKWMLLALGVNLTAVTAIIVLPLVYPDGLPAQIFQKVIYAPAAAPVTLVRTASPPAAAAQQRTILFPNLSKPVTPGTRAAAVDSDLPPSLLTGTGPGMDGVTGGDSLNPALFRPALPRVTNPVQTDRMSVSQGVAEGLLISSTTPRYPEIAKRVGVSGTVTLSATISKTGSIENLRVVSGHPLLRQAAMEAVQRWRYRPYLLDNQPVDVETTINVVFALGGH